MAKNFFANALSPPYPNSHPTPYQLPTNSLPTPTKVGFGRSFIMLKHDVLIFINKIHCRRTRSCEKGKQEFFLPSFAYFRFFL